MFKQIINPVNVFKCVIGDDTFEEGKYYTSIRDNNGIQIQFKNNEGDCKTKLVHCINDVFSSPDGNPRPTFIPIPSMLLVIDD